MLLVGLVLGMVVGFYNLWRRVAAPRGPDRSRKSPARTKQPHPMMQPSASDATCSGRSDLWSSTLSGMYGLTRLLER